MILQTILIHTQGENLTSAKKVVPTLHRLQRQWDDMKRRARDDEYDWDMVNFAVKVIYLFICTKFRF